MYRLATISEKLSKKISQSTDDLQREIIIKSCEYAIDKAKLSIIPLVSNILERYINNYNLELHQQKKLEKLLKIYEEEYLELQDAEENERYLVSFGRARALSAILYCFESDLSLAANEAFYEASIYQIINDLLG